MNKNVWKRPELIVLVRGRPEEVLVQKCKTGNASGPDSDGCMIPASCEYTKS